MNDRRFSLLLVSHSYPPVLGGSEIEAQRVCSALLRRGHQVTVLCSGGPPMPDVSSWTDPAGVPVRIFGRHRLGRDYAFALGVAWTLLWKRRRYQMVYFLMQGLHLAAGMPVARLLGKPVVMKVSGSSIITAMRGSWMGRLELWFLRRWAHRVMILNPGMVEEAAAAGLKPDRLLWMPNPVDTDEFAPCAPERRRELRARLGLEPSARAAIFVGRLAPEKELPSLIQAFAAARRGVPNAVLVLVGDGPMRSDLETLAAGLSLDGAVRFIGRQTGLEVRQWLQASDVFALVSSNEGLPCSLLEAMSVGLPSVISNIPANVQLVETGVHGLHAALGSADLIAAALQRLLLDAPLRARMGAAARERILDGYSIDKVMDRYEALFSEALDAAQTGL
jgi:glycosyltransferase involved in cell wall biosynthesis